MKVQTQIEIHNKNQVIMAMREGKREHDRPNQAMAEAAKLAGEFIAGKNNGKLTKVDEVIKYYKPEYLQKRGII